MESASYIENNINNGSVSSNDIIEEDIPKLFSEEQSFQENTEIDNNNNESIGSDSEQLFDQDTNEEEDFEIPAFLRKQKF